MSEIDKLSNSFEETLKDSDLSGIAVDLGEVAVDTILSEGLLKDVPIIGTIIGLTKTAINVNNRLFLKKIVNFLKELDDTDPKQRQKLINQVDGSTNYEIKVGLKLLYILDKCDDHITARYIAKLFRAFLKEKISYSEFLRGATIIQNVFIEDFKYFLKTPVEDIEKEISPDASIPDIENNLVNYGLCAMITDRVRVYDQDDPDLRHERYVVEGGGTIIYITDIGYKIKQVFQ